jgi:hypothetical protein
MTVLSYDGPGGPKNMNKSSKSISLVLMGAAALFIGCRGEEDKDENGVARVGSGARMVTGTGFRSRAGGAVSASPSARGGFGAIGSGGSGS